MKNIKRRTVSGLGWNAATQTLVKVLQFATLIVLARLLSPDKFGLIAMVLVISGFASSIADVGLGASIIQKQALSERHLDAVFWLNVATGGALTLVFILAAPLIAGFYGEPQLQLLTIVLAFNFMLGSLKVVHYALLLKALDFRRLFWVQTIAISISSVVATFLALSGAGVWSLAARSLCETLLQTIVTWRLSSWRPRLTFDPAAVKELLRFGQHLVGSNIVIYCAQNFDKLAIGHQLGGAALGIYNLSDRLMRMPLTNVVAVTGAVMFPALSTLQDDLQSLKRGYLRATRMIALLTFPMMLGLSVLAQPAILVVYGAQWRSAVGIVQVLCFAGMAQSVYNTASWIFLSRGRPDILFRLGILSLVVRVTGILIGMNWGLIGVAWAYMLGGYLCLLYPTWSSAGRLIDLNFVELLKNAAGPFYCATGMAVTMWLSDRWLFVDRADGLRLIAGTLGGIAIYSFLVTCLKLQAWQDVRELILTTVGQRSRLIRSMLGDGRRMGS
jgi:O-antigen/teichoic acid export membrane protein